jgi:hypothetical protein
MNNMSIHLNTNSKHDKQIDASSLSWCEMALLKKQDPFMYYSIPGNRDTHEIKGKDIDLSDMKISRCPGVRRRTIQVVEFVGPVAKVPCRRTSFTTMKDKKKEEVHRTLEPEESHPNIVKRKSAISFESCDIYLDEMMEEIRSSVTSTNPVVGDIDLMNDGFLDWNDEFDD